MDGQTANENQGGGKSWLRKKRWRNQTNNKHPTTQAIQKQFYSLGVVVTCDVDQLLARNNSNR